MNLAKVEEIHSQEKFKNFKHEKLQILFINILIVKGLWKKSNKKKKKIRILDFKKF